MISIILPWVRKDGYNRCVSAVFDAVEKGTAFEIVAEQDVELAGCNPMVNRLVARSKYPVVCFLHDDSEPLKGFLENALAVMKTFDGGWGCVGFNDLVHGEDGPCTHWMIHKKMLRFFPDGVFYSEDYVHSRVDQELKDISAENNRYKWAENAKIIHHSRVNKGAKHMDFLSFRCYGKVNTEHDRKIYEKRKAERNSRSGFQGP